MESGWLVFLTVALYEESVGRQDSQHFPKGSRGGILRGCSMRNGATEPLTVRGVVGRVQIVSSWVLTRHELFSVLHSRWVRHWDTRSILGVGAGAAMISWAKPTAPIDAQRRAASAHGPAAK